MWQGSWPSRSLSLRVGLRRRGLGLSYLQSQPGFLARGLSLTAGSLPWGFCRPSHFWFCWRWLTPEAGARGGAGLRGRQAPGAALPRSPRPQRRSGCA